MRGDYARLKRDIDDKRLVAKMVVRCGEPIEKEEQLPERLRGWRELPKYNSVGLIFKSATGEESPCWISRAGLVDYDGKALVIYSPAYREPNERERKILEEWESYKKTEDYQNAYSPYWKGKSFFLSRGAEYLFHGEEEKGCKMDMNKYYGGEKACIRDKSIKGEVFMKYEIGAI